MTPSLSNRLSTKIFEFNSPRLNRNNFVGCTKAQQVEKAIVKNKKYLAIEFIIVQTNFLSNRKKKKNSKRKRSEFTEKKRRRNLKINPFVNVRLPFMEIFRRSRPDIIHRYSQPRGESFQVFIKNLAEIISAPTRRRKIVGDLRRSNMMKFIIVFADNPF